MQFTHDAEVSLRAAAALVNSAPARDGADALASSSDLDAFVERWSYTGRHDHTVGEVAAVQALRPRLLALWTSPEADVVTLVNQLLADAEALPQLVNHDHWGWHLHATPSDAPLADRIAVETAMAMVDVIRMGGLDRLKVCAAEDCDDVLVDLSRNRSRQFCDGGCGNRANVAAYRARQAAHG